MSRDARIYVGNLPRDCREREIEDIFYKYGRIVDIAMKGPFCFVSFEDSRDAKDAVHYRDGYEFGGARLRVELANAGRRGDDRDRRLPGGRASYTGRHSQYKVIVQGLPGTCSWQDLKDFCRGAGDPLFTDVNRDGSGVVEFSSGDDMEWALKNLDGKKLKTHLSDEAYVTVTADGDSRGGRGGDDRRDSRRDDDRRRDRSRSPARRSRSRSPVKRSRSRSPVRKDDRSPARKSSRSPAPRSRSRSPAPRSRSRSPAPRSRSRSPAPRSRSRSPSPKHDE